MNVHAYYEPILGRPEPSGLLSLWAGSWRARGFTPVVLNESHARAHLGYGYVRARIDLLPTVNPAAYERACYLRHLAMAEVGGGLMTDYDVINYNFFPADLRRVTAHRKVLILEPTRVPCAMWASQEGWEDVVDLLCAYKPDHLDHHNQQAHVSDMTILRRTETPFVGLCVEAGCSGDSVRDQHGEGWRTAKLVHFSGFYFGKNKLTGSKESLIPTIRPLWSPEAVSGLKFLVSGRVPETRDQKPETSPFSP